MPSGRCFPFKRLCIFAQAWSLHLKTPGGQASGTHLCSPAACRKADTQPNAPQQATEKGCASEYRIVNFIPRSHHRDYQDSGRVLISGKVFAHKYREPFFVRQMSEKESNTSLGDKFAAQFFSGSSLCHGTLFESEV